MNTSAWGPASWRSMFFIAAGYDLNESPKSVKDPRYKQYLKTIGYVLPCKYCRDSYEKFYESMDIQRYLDMPSCGLIRFVYDMKNLVNAKLIAQEQKALEEAYAVLVNGRPLDDPEVARGMEEAKARICYTKPAPPFEELVADLMQHRASCSPALKTCRAPLKNGAYPAPPRMPVLPVHPLSDGVLYRKEDGIRTPSSRPRARSRLAGGARLRRSSRYKRSRSGSRRGQYRKLRNRSRNTKTSRNRSRTRV